VGCLTRRPSQATTSEKVEVQVRHRVPGDLADVEHQTVSVGHQAFAKGDRLGGREQVGDVIAVIRGHIIGRCDVDARDDQDMRRGLRVEVTEGVAPLAGEHLRRGDLVADDPTKETVVAHYDRP
jgi:hypothetical protein